MKIAKIEDLHCDAGWRTFSFLKVTTDDGLVGWSEYTEADGSRGLTSVIHGMAEALIGTDPRPVQAIDSLLYVKQVQAPNGINQRAIAAIEKPTPDQTLIRITAGIARCWSASQSSGSRMRCSFSR